jgi:hypothetical protein
MKLIIKVIILLIFFYSCSKQEKGEATDETVTPETFTESPKLDLKSYSSRYRQDIIEELFEEAQEKNDSLKKLVERLETLNSMKNDSLRSFKNYQSTNESYWHTVKSYAARLNDSSLKVELNGMISTLENNHDKRVSHHRKLINEVDSIEVLIADLEILMKILVTEPMMRNYQVNELPEKESIEELKKSMEEVAEELKPYSRIKK